MRIMVTNDDGYAAPGIRALAAAAQPHGEVFVVAPDREQSATSHSITMHRPLRARLTPDGWWAVDGTPVDSVILGIARLLPSPPDLCLSGINHGPNMGEDILYSGTVSAAMEATVHGIPAVAVSHATREVSFPPEEVHEWRGVVQELLARILDRDDFPRGTLLNINLPPVRPEDLRGVRVTSLGRRHYEGSLQRFTDPSGKNFYWIGGGELRWDHDDDCDFYAIEEGYVSVSPVRLELTNHEIIEEIRAWDLTL